MGVPQEDVVDSAGSDELYIGFVWNGFRKGLSAISFAGILAVYMLETPFAAYHIQVSGLLFLLLAIISTGKTFHFDVKSDLFRYHQTFMLLSLSWVEAGRVSQMRVAKFVTIEYTVSNDSGMSQVKTYEVLHLIFEKGEPFHFVSIFGRSHLEKIKSKINRFLFENRQHELNVKYDRTDAPPSDGSLVQPDDQPTLGDSEADEISTFW